MLKGPITMPKANKLCVEWSLAGQNRFVNDWGTGCYKRFQENFFFAPFCPHVRFLERSKRSLHREESNVVCLIKIGWEFLEITRGGSEAHTPQTEQFRDRQNRVNTFWQVLGFYTSRICYNFTHFFHICWSVIFHTPP